DVALVAFVVCAPDAIEEGVSGPRASRFRREQLENLKLERRQIDTKAVSHHFMTTLIDYEIADFDAFAIRFLWRSAAASQQRLDSILQLARTERLCEVIVCACFEAS